MKYLVIRHAQSKSLTLNMVAIHWKTNTKKNNQFFDLLTTNLFTHPAAKFKANVCYITLLFKQLQAIRTGPSVSLHQKKKLYIINSLWYLVNG